MNEIQTTQDEEVNLIEVIKILWKGKWIIIIATLIALLFGLIFALNQIKSFSFTTSIEPSKSTTFINFIPINDILKENDLYLSSENLNGYKLDSASIFQMILDEFKDKEEMIFVLEKNDYLNELTKDLAMQDKYEAFIAYADLFKISMDEEESFMSFQWHDVKEGKELLEEGLQLCLQKVKVNILSDLKKLANFIDMKNQRQLEGLRLALTLIEKELPFVDQEFSKNLEIDKEIETLKETILMSFDYNALKETIVSFGRDFTSSQLTKSLSVVENSDPSKWVNYNLSLSDIESQNNVFRNIAIFALLGLILSSLFVLLSSFVRRFNKI